MESQLRVNTSTTEEDVLQLSRYYTKGHAFTWCAILIILIAILTLIVWWFDTYHIAWTLTIIGIMIGILPYRAQSVTRRNFQKSPFKGANNIYDIDQEGIQIESTWKEGSSSSRFSWEKFQKIVEQKDAFFLFINPCQAYIIAKRHFENEEQIALFREIYTQCMQAVQLEWTIKKGFVATMSTYTREHAFSMLIILLYLISLVVSVYPLLDDISTVTIFNHTEQTTDHSLQDSHGLNGTQNTPRGTREVIKRHVETFFEALKAGSFDQALFVYKRIIALSDNNELFTASNLQDATLTSRLTSVTDQLKNIGSDPKAASQLLLNKGIVEYDIGNFLYYSNREKYQLALLYHWLLAIESFRQSNQLHNNAIAHRYIGVVMMDTGAPMQFAISELIQATVLDPNDATSYYKLWNAYRATKDYNLAIESYQKGVGIDGNHEFLRLNLWVAYFSNREREKGYQTYQDLIKMCTNFCYVAHFNMANQLKQDGKYDDALVAFDKAIDGAKAKMDIYRNAYRQKGALLYLLSRYDEAIASYTMALNDPNDTEHYDNNFNQNDSDDETYAQLVSTYVMIWDYNKARLYVQKGISLYPWNEELTKLNNLIQSHTPNAMRQYNKYR